MASIDEIISAIHSNISQCDDAAGAINSTVGVADEVSSNFQALGAEGQTAQANACKEQLNEAIQLLEPVKAKLAEAISTAESMKS